ncbi:MAG: ribosome assembly RNA-binding protein YhbY [Tissierellales bacterium]|nr:ribosome assembly RNA-binding protein YhbY [Tissierellales bacterium]HCX04586.1 ribosome assembly RNA-binding protein YhbY [Clostridiales bacterium]
MLSGKERSYLKSLANKLEPIMQIGKNGLTEDVLKSIDEALEARELIKINLLNNSLLDTKETALEICDSLKAEYIQSIGNKIIIYRESEEKVIELPKK